MARERKWKVNGVLISNAALDAASERMQRTTVFKTSDVTRWLIEEGIPAYVEHRHGPDLVACIAADRLVQAERKAGRIMHERGEWGPTS